MNPASPILRSALVSEVAGVSPNTLKAWVGRGLLKPQAPQAGTWTAYDFYDLLTVCAWAEVNRAGISPQNATGLVEAIERSLIALAFNRPPGIHAPRPINPEEGHFVLAEIWDRLDDEPDRLRMAVTTRNREGVRYYFQVTQVEAEHATTVLLVDTIKLWRRIESALKALLGEVPRP